MIRVLFISLFLLITLEARENPFFPAKGEKDIPYTSNNVKSLEALKRSSITLPSSARIIKKVTIEYANLDASIETKSIILDNSIDWHLPIFISQSYAQTENKTKQIQATSKKIKSIKYKQIASVKYAKFLSSNKTLKVLSKDKIIRNFLLVNPHRIVLDFKRDASLKSYIKENKKGIFTKVRVGNHSGYYRAVIELDGQYRYKMQKISNGYLFKLR
ncbi:AMIN domain-containing protein [Sulfurimonas sp.]|uniref:AMIN domain-containing protein n=1 Tax=Sulfurimonas sp. TaxID=2022749 RepID=UPI0025F26A00|nr:AMIN domain-containing protein [Sulfurimonas sp.]